jgi:hypothetical protein
MTRIKVNIIDGASPALKKLVRSLSGDQKRVLNEQGARAAINASVKYHRAFNQNGGWRGPRYLGSVAGSGSFGADVARSWKTDSVRVGGATIANDATHYAHKVTGGTIVPKRAKDLTIPLIKEAKGIRAAVYSQNSGNKLFGIPGKKALFEKIGGDRRGGTSRIRAVYALVKSVTQKPWPDALPPDGILQDAYADAFMDGLEDIIEKS